VNAKPKWAELRLTGTEGRNAASNLAYVLAGALVFAVVFDARAAVFFTFMYWLGLGSFLYHLDWTNGTYRAFDWSGMYGVMGCLIPLAIDPPHPQIWWWMLATGATLAFILPFFWRVGEANALVGILFGLSAIPAYFNGDVRWAGAAIILFLLAKAAWVIDVYTERLGVWGHAIWHKATAVGFGCVFLALIGGLVR
jgi:hypothetical protein